MLVCAKCKTKITTDDPNAWFLQRAWCIKCFSDLQTILAVLGSNPEGLKEFKGLK